MRFISNNIKIHLFLFFLLILSFSTTIYLEQYINKNLPRHHPSEDLKYLPSGKFLKSITLSYDEILADLLWIKALAYFGEHYVGDRTYDWLYHILNITNILDPLFEDPYEFGGIILGHEIGNIEKSMAILNEGIKNVPKNHPRYWYLYFFTGLNYMFFYQDYVKTAYYLEQAAKFPKSPPYLPLLVAKLYTKANKSETAISFLEEIEKSTKSPEMKDNIQRRIKDIKDKKNLKLYGLEEKVDLNLEEGENLKINISPWLINLSLYNIEI
ncbi:MAG: hypothetical protein HQK79_05255 [Desulfobacterales bacterium]|nr:hypothetical protein [Desulfobacterales bacterium]